MSCVRFRRNLFSESESGTKQSFGSGVPKRSLGTRTITGPQPAASTFLTAGKLRRASRRELQCRRGNGYDSWMRGAQRHLMLRQRITALMTLAAFIAGSFGLPMPARPAKAQSGTPSLLLAGKSCCCGHKVSTCSCGCSHRPLAQKSANKGSCGQKSRAASFPVLNCPCSGPDAAGFLVASQPKLATSTAVDPHVLETFGLSPLSSVRMPQGNPAPDTPPPRPSVV